jgi:hypothetical protein
MACQCAIANPASEALELMLASSAKYNMIPLVLAQALELLLLKSLSLQLHNCLHCASAMTLQPVGLHLSLCYVVKVVLSMLSYKLNIIKS